MLLPHWLPPGWVPPCDWLPGHMILKRLASGCYVALATSSHAEWCSGRGAPLGLPLYLLEPVRYSTAWCLCWSVHTSELRSVTPPAHQGFSHHFSHHLQQQHHCPEYGCSFTSTIWHPSVTQWYPLTLRGYLPTTSPLSPDSTSHVTSPLETKTEHTLPLIPLFWCLPIVLPLALETLHCSDFSSPGSQLL